MTFRLAEQPKQVIAFVSLGDCKIYHYSASTKQAIDLTAGNRTDFRDIRDPGEKLQGLEFDEKGGRLGPMKGEKGEPDLKNLNAGHYICDDGDFIIAVSDGIHDNLDPMYAGKILF